MRDTALEGPRTPATLIERREPVESDVESREILNGGDRESAENLSAVDMRALTEAFEQFTKMNEALEESYRRLEMRVESLDEELQAKNQELALTTEYLNSILESMSDGVIAVDTEGVITTFNRAAGEVLGHRSGEVVGKPFRQVFGEEFSPSSARRVAELRTHKGHRVPVSERNSPVADRSNLRLGSVKVFQDLREIEALREQVRRKDRLAALGEMAATVAHEIKNPLGGIRGFAALLLQDVEKEDPRYRLVEKIIAGTKSLDHVVNELLEYTRPMELNLKTENLAALVRASLGYLDAGGHRVRIDNTVDPDVCAAVDSNKIRQVFLNVLLNAAQSMEDEGVITITSQADGTTVTVGIGDTGCGIPEEEFEHLFSPFYTTKEKGTGLGLAVASKIVEGHGGVIEVTSEVGKGSKFWIRLPRGD